MLYRNCSTLHDFIPTAVKIFCSMFYIRYNCVSLRSVIVVTFEQVNVAFSFSRKPKVEVLDSMLENSFVEIMSCNHSVSSSVWCLVF